MSPERWQFVDCPCGYGPKPEQPVIVAEAAMLGRSSRMGDAIREVAVWLRDCAHENHWLRDEGELQQWALWLINVRDRFEAISWGPG